MRFLAFLLRVIQDSRYGKSVIVYLHIDLIRELAIRVAYFSLFLSLSNFSMSATWRSRVKVTKSICAAKNFIIRALRTLRPKSKKLCAVKLLPTAAVYRKQLLNSNVSYMDLMMLQQRFVKFENVSSSLRESDFNRIKNIVCIIFQSLRKNILSWYTILQEYFRNFTKTISIAGSRERAVSSSHWDNERKKMVGLIIF